MYVITGASGNTGKVVAQALLAAGKPVRAIGRDEARLAELVAAGAEAAVGDLQDTAFLTGAFRGATAVYALIPSNYGAPDFRAYQKGVAESIAAAVREAGVTHVVALSSVGAHLPEGAGVVQGLYDMEQTFNALPGVHVLHLRPTYFLENLYGQIGTVKALGAMGSPIRADLRFPVVHTSDIAAVAAARLVDLAFTGKEVEYVLGAEDVDHQQVARVLGAAIGRPDLPYIEFPYADAERAMVSEWGLGPSAAAAYIEFLRSMNEGRIYADAVRTPQNTTPTRLADFAPAFAAAYQAS